KRAMSPTVTAPRSNRSRRSRAATWSPRDLGGGTARKRYGGAVAFGVPLDLRALIDRIGASGSAPPLGQPGAQRRFLRHAGGSDAALPDPYGCADAVNILYTLGRLPRDRRARTALAEVLGGLQDPASGMFREATHHEIHTTAHCVAALELLDVKPI